MNSSRGTISRFDADPPRRLLRRDFWALAVLIALTVAMSLPMLRHWAYTPGDYALHSVVAEQMRQKKGLSAPHFVYHGILAVCQHSIDRLMREGPVHSVAELSQAVADPHAHMPLITGVGRRYAVASIITALPFVVALGVILWVITRWSLSSIPWARDWIGDVIAVCVALGMLLIGPVSVFSPLDGRWYLGYIGLNVWHNPTMLVVKPLALLSFIYAASLFGSRADHTGRLSSAASAAAGAAVTILCTLAKPNYTLCLLPGTALFVAWAWHRKLRIRWTPMMLGLVLPAMAVLLWQYQFAYQSGNARPNSIIFAPLAAMRLLSPQHMLPKFLLSIIFPVMVGILFFRQLRVERRLALAWFVFACSLGFMYLAAEALHTGDGNFLWGAQVALLVLFVESMRVVLGNLPVGLDADQWRRWLPTAICAAAFILHVSYGIAYNLRILRGGDAAWPAWW